MGALGFSFLSPYEFNVKYEGAPCVALHPQKEPLCDGRPRPHIPIPVQIQHWIQRDSLCGPPSTKGIPL